MGVRCDIRRFARCQFAQSKKSVCPHWKFKEGCIKCNSGTFIYLLSQTPLAGIPQKFAPLPLRPELLGETGNEKLKNIQHTTVSVRCLRNIAITLSTPRYWGSPYVA